LAAPIKAELIVAVKVGRGGEEDAAEPSGRPSDASVGAMLDQSGVIRVDTLTQMFHTASVLTRQALPAGPRVAVLTNSWGPAFLATDALEGSSRNQHGWDCRHSAEQRREGIETEPHNEHPSRAEHVTRSPAKKQEPAECDCVRAHHPLQAVVVEAETGPDFGQCNIHDVVVDRDDQLSSSKERQHKPRFPTILHVGHRELLHSLWLPATRRVTVER
jgi:hypothetical protein